MSPEDRNGELPEEVRKNLHFLTVRKIQNPERYGGFSRRVFTVLRATAVVLFPAALIAGLVCLFSRSKVRSVQGQDLVITSAVMMVLLLGIGMLINLR